MRACSARAENWGYEQPLLEGPPRGRVSLHRENQTKDFFSRADPPHPEEERVQYRCDTGGGVGRALLARDGRRALLPLLPRRRAAPPAQDRLGRHARREARRRLRHRRTRLIDLAQIESQSSVAKGMLTVFMFEDVPLTALQVSIVAGTGAYDDAALVAAPRCTASPCSRTRCAAAPSAAAAARAHLSLMLRILRARPRCSTRTSSRTRSRSRCKVQQAAAAKKDAENAALRAEAREEAEKTSRRIDELEARLRVATHGAAKRARRPR